MKEICGKPRLIYRFPIEECEILKIENVSAEELKILPRRIEEEITRENLQKHGILLNFG